MSSDIDGGDRPHLRRREWFTVRFGGRLLRSDKLVQAFNEQAVAFFERANLPLERTPFTPIIFSEQNDKHDQAIVVSQVNDNLGRIERANNADDLPGPYLPLIFLVDDQTLVDFFTVLRDNFQDRAFIFQVMSSRLQECFAIQRWEPILNELGEYSEIIAKVDPHDPVSIDWVSPTRPDRAIDNAAHRNRVYRNPDDDNRTCRNPDDDNRTYRNPDDDARSGSYRSQVPNEYQVPDYRNPIDNRSNYLNPVDDRASASGYDMNLQGSIDNRSEYRNRPVDDRSTTVREEKNRSESGNAKMRLTIELMNKAIGNCSMLPVAKEDLAEDFERMIDLDRSLVKPFFDDYRDRLKLLHLLIMAVENGASKGEDRERAKRAKLRARLTEMMLQSGLLEDIWSTYIRDANNIVNRAETSDEDVLLLSEAVDYLLRAFVQLLQHDVCLETADDLWTRIETRVFLLPARFWRLVPSKTAERYCRMAAEITDQNSIDVFMNSIQKMIDDDDDRMRNDARPQPRPTRDDVADAGYGAPQGYGIPKDYGSDIPPPPEPECRDPEGYDEWNQQEDYRTGRDDYGGQKDQDAYSRHSKGDDYGNDQRPRSPDDDGWYGAPSSTRNDDRQQDYGSKEYGSRPVDQQHREEKPQQQQQQIVKASKETKMSLRFEDMNAVMWERYDREEPPMPYRKMADAPTVDELMFPMVPFLRRNKLEGAYRDNEHYLDVQFRLLREDMVSPLRDGLHIYKMNGTSSRNKNIDEGELTSDLLILNAVTVSGLQVRPNSGDLMRFVSIPFNEHRHMDPGRNLRYGQCIALSKDEFRKDIHIGLIVERNKDEAGTPWDGRIGVSFLDDKAASRATSSTEGGGPVTITIPTMEPIDTGAYYTLAEPSGYFEAYNPVLKVMKKMRRYTPFPFERYLVHGKTDPKRPAYMRVREKEEHEKEDKEMQIKYMQMMRDDQKKEKEKKKAAMSSSKSSTESCEDESPNDSSGGYETDEEEVRMVPLFAHPNPADLERITIRERTYNIESLETDLQATNLDETQKKAVAYALTSELAIIQGPPGTGKTHIGVEIVTAILENRTRWRMTEPILIVTYTNQALDQFLEKIHKTLLDRGWGRDDPLDGPIMVRLGSRSESEYLMRSDVLMRDMLDKYESECANSSSLGAKNQAREHCSAIACKLARAIRIVRTSRQCIFNFSVLVESMSRTHQHASQFRALQALMRDSSNNVLNADEALACWLLDKDYAKKRDLPPEDGADAGGIELDFASALSKVKMPGHKHAVDAKKVKKCKKNKKETKKEHNERKRAERRRGLGWCAEDEDEDGEEEDDDDTEEDGEESDDELEEDNGCVPEEDYDAKLIEQLKQLNVEADVLKVAAAKEDRWMTEKYEMGTMWELEKNPRYAEDVAKLLIFGTNMKSLNKGVRVYVDSTIRRDLEDSQEMILAADPLTQSEADEIVDVLKLPKQMRWRLFNYWQAKTAETSRAELPKRCREYESACQMVDRKKLAVQAELCRMGLVIGATTTGAAKRRGLLNAIGCKVLVVEEAAEVLEAHLLASIIPTTQHAIFIGDHQQLRPSTTVHELAKSANLDVSLFERLVKGHYPFHTLALQHRMLAPLTSTIVQPYFYNSLRDAPSVLAYPEILGMQKRMFFWAHQTAEEVHHDSMSHSNAYEAKCAVALAIYLLRQGQYDASQITIIATYALQVKLIKDQLAAQSTPGYRSQSDEQQEEGLRAIEVHTVDSFQGKENRVIILSLVRSTPFNTVGFLATVNRICVALTRAQHAFYMLGNLEFIAAHSRLWDDIMHALNNADYVDYDLPIVCQRHGNKQGVKYVHYFPEQSPAGGCTEVCGFDQKCGHPCKLVCHPPCEHDEYSGKRIECHEPCLRKCNWCGSACTKRCYMDCGEGCAEVVTITLDCGHTVRTVCASRNLARCIEPCQVVLDCNHKCTRKCSAQCITVEQCETSVNHLFLPCKHELPVPCHQVNLMIVKELPKCFEKCPKKLVCGHKCPNTCGERCPTICEATVQFSAPCGHTIEKKCSDDPARIVCEKQVSATMPICMHSIKIKCYRSGDSTACHAACGQRASCGHTCERTCGECCADNYSHQCNHPCARSLACGHPCRSKCGRECADCTASCRTACSHIVCGSPQPGSSKDIVAHGRACSEPCVLCDKMCDNRCEHRACSKRCYEVCDVSACDQPCKALLRCKHACMGLCGEACPEICGTCSTMRYKEMLKSLGDAYMVKGEVVRIIEMPLCGHMFPVQYVDEHVIRQAESGTISTLSCPRCGKSIDSLKRYGRTRRRLQADADSRKWLKRYANLMPGETSQEYIKTRNAISAAHSELVKLNKVNCNARQRGNYANFSTEIFRILDAATSSILTEMDRAREARDLPFWMCLAECYRSLAQVVLMYLSEDDILKWRKVEDNLPMLKGVVLDAFDGRRHARSAVVKDLMQESCQMLIRSMSTRRPGILMPQMRVALTRNYLYLHMERLHQYIRNEHSWREREVDDAGRPLCVADVPRDFAQGVRKAIREIKEAPPASGGPEIVLGHIVDRINRDVYTAKLKREDLCKPAFVGDFPSF